MNIVVWVVTGVLAAAFLGAGSLKLLKSQADMIEAGQGWAADFSPGAIKTIGALELSAVAGLILPGAFGVATWLVPAAAIGLILVMIGAARTHLRRSEPPNAVVNLVLLALAAFVAIERIGPQSF